MTYAEAITLKQAIEAALLTSSASGAVTVSHGSRSITYSSQEDAMATLGALNRDIATYNRRKKNQNPYARTARWQ